VAPKRDSGGAGAGLTVIGIRKAAALAVFPALRIAWQSGLAALWLFSTRREAPHSGLRAVLGPHVLHNVRAKPTGAAGSLRLGCDDAPSAAGQP
jgi:hypothetical protein